MTRRQTMTVAAKEARALVLPWLGGMAVLLFSLLTGRWRELAWLSYFLAAALLGGLSVGHEYNERTLDSLLAQPVSRRRLFAIKQAVLAVMILLLSAVALPLLFGGSAPPKTEAWLALTFTIFGALFIAPHLTMVCRSALAGAIFTGSIPGLLLTVSGLLGVLRYGLDGAAIQPFQLAFMKWGMLMQCAISAVMSWRTFAAIEALGGVRSFEAPAWLGKTRGQADVAERTMRRPIWVLIRKELRLQPMTFTIAGLYVVGWLGATAAARVFPEALQIFKVLTVFYAGFVALLAGALASAEERLLGTLEWQMLLPIASRTQWRVKAAVAFGLAMALAWGLPVTLLQLNAAGRQVSPQMLLPLTQPLFIGLLAMVTAAGLYASSVATSGLRALMVSLPGLYGAGLLTWLVLDRLGPVVYTIVRSRGLEPGALFVQRVALLPPLAVGVALAALVLTFAHTNHRSADRPAGRISWQMTWLTASLGCGVALVVVISSL